MLKKTLFGAALGFIINFQSAYNPFYFPNWFSSQTQSYYLSSEYTQKGQIAMNTGIKYYEQNRN